MSVGPVHRRQRTKWLLTAPVVALVLVVAGVWWLESLAPIVDVSGREVEGVPQLGSEDTPSCTRADDPETIEQIRLGFPTAGRITSTQVHLCPRAYDGLEVTYAGEVIGELLPRQGGAWAQVNDDTYALEVGPLVGHRQQAGFNTGLSVWLPEELTGELTGAGRAGVRGDVISVRGTLLRADPDDGGGITIRAEELELLAVSETFEDPFHTLQAIVAAVLAALAAASLLWARAVRRR